MPDSLCDENSPISCTKSCEPDRESAVCSNDTICDRDQNCIMLAINTTDHTSVYVFINGLGCAVLKSYTQDICRVLFRKYAGKLLIGMININFAFHSQNQLW